MLSVNILKIQKFSCFPASILAKEEMYLQEFRRQSSRNDIKNVQLWKHLRLHNFLSGGGAEPENLIYSLLVFFAKI